MILQSTPKLPLALADALPPLPQPLNVLLQLDLVHQLAQHHLSLWHLAQSFPAVLKEVQTLLSIKIVLDPIQHFFTIWPSGVLGIGGRGSGGGFPKLLDGRQQITVDLFSSKKFSILLLTRFEALLDLELITCKVDHVHFQVLLLLGELAGKPEPSGLLEVRHHQVGNPLLYFLQDFLSLLEIFGIISWIDTVHETLKGICCPNPRSIVPFLAQVAYLQFQV